MKLKYWRTICVGFAFFLICTFWQAYDTIIPKILTDKFGMSQAGSGIVMALDNMLALFMLPLFGAISDRCTSKYGKRTPFIFVGTIVAVAAFMCLSLVDGQQLKNVDAIAGNDTATLQAIYADDDVANAELMTSEGERFVIRDKFTEEEFLAIVPASSAYDDDINFDWNTYVVPARQAYAEAVTASHQLTLWFFIGILLVTLVAMATFRSPAVALMPDVTIKPLRSKANAVINLMGTAGGILVLVLGMIFGTGKPENSYMGYTVFFAVVGAVMIAALIAFLITVKEPRFAREMEDESRRFGIDDSDADGSSDRKLNRSETASLLLILASVALWYFGYNAVISKYSVYSTKILGLDYNTTLLIAQAAAIISYLPVGIIASKVGRKKTILAGVVMLGAAFFVASFLRQGSSPLLMNCMFALAGIGWATINVNSFPMVVELARGGRVGKYTGYYYAASMAAQALTPFLSGIIMDNFGMTTLFPYATVFVALAFVTMIFVKHGDNKPIAKKGLEALDVDD